jgi:hypothetical protein
MTPKEKAEELVLKFKELPQEGTMMFYAAFEISKQCALIAVDEIIKSIRWSSDFNNEQKKHWQEVKQEIEKL